MRIAVVCSRLDARGGGMERLARDFIECLLDKGLQPLVVTRKADRAQPLAKRIDDLREVPVGFLPGKLRDRWFSWRAGRIKRRERVDVLVAFQRLDNTDIANCGGTHPGFLRAMGRAAGWVDRMHIDLERKQFGKAKFVAAASAFMSRELQEFYNVPASRIKVLHPPVDVQRFRVIDDASRAALRQRLGMAPDKKYLLFPSGDHVRKGLPFLSRYFSDTELPAELWVAGRGVRSEGRVRGIGYLKNIEEYYQAADATVMASLYEPFGMVGVESVMCGTPAVLSSNMGCCEALCEPGLVTFEPGDIAGLDQALRRALALDRGLLRKPESCLTYDPGREAFAEELLRLCREG